MRLGQVLLYLAPSTEKNVTWMKSTISWTPSAQISTRFAHLQLDKDIPYVFIVGPCQLWRFRAMGARSETSHRCPWCHSSISADNTRRRWFEFIHWSPGKVDNLQSKGTVIDYRNWHLALGRRFRSLKLWFVFRSFGAEGFRNHIRRVSDHIVLYLRFWVTLIFFPGYQVEPWIRRLGFDFQIPVSCHSAFLCSHCFPAQAERDHSEAACSFHQFAKQS